MKNPNFIMLHVYEKPVYFNICQITTITTSDSRTVVTMVDDDYYFVDESLKEVMSLINLSLC